MMYSYALGLLLCVCTTAILSGGRYGCLQIEGICVEYCPRGEHVYNSDCTAPTWSQRTCNSPQPYDMGAVCDLSRCDCDEPAVRDELTGDCVHIRDCLRPPPGFSY